MSESQDNTVYTLIRENRPLAPLQLSTMIMGNNALTLLDTSFDNCVLHASHRVDQSSASAHGESVTLFLVLSPENIEQTAQFKFAFRLSDSWRFAPEFRATYAFTSVSMEESDMALAFCEQCDFQVSINENERLVSVVCSTCVGFTRKTQISISVFNAVRSD